MLNILLTHLAAPAVEEQLDYLREIAPDSRFAVCHGGSSDDFHALCHKEKVFLDDPSLRAPPRTFQSYHETLAAVFERFVRDDASVTSIYVFEYDHVILHGAFERRLLELAKTHRADFMGKTCVERTSTNWLHYLRFRRDEALLAHLRRLSVHEDATRMYGCLGNGFWLTRAALEAYVAVEDRPECYGELYVPTVLHHLGFRLVDIGSHSDVYRHVRADGDFTLEEVVELKRQGEMFVHPYKGPGAVTALRRSVGAGSRSSI